MTHLIKSDKREEYLRQLIAMQYGLYTYVLSLCGTLSDADDLLQNTNLRIMQLLGKEDEPTPVIDHFQAWARKVAFFQVMTWRKDRKRNPVLFDEETFTKIAESLAEDETDTSLDDTRAAALETCLEELPPALRRMADERYRPGGNIERMARERKTTAHAMSMNLYRIRLMLKACIEKTLSEGKE